MKDPASLEFDSPKNHCPLHSPFRSETSPRTQRVEFYYTLCIYSCVYLQDAKASRRGDVIPFESLWIVAESLPITPVNPNRTEKAQKQLQEQMNTIVDKLERTSVTLESQSGSVTKGKTNLPTCADGRFSEHEPDSCPKAELNYSRLASGPSPRLSDSRGHPEDDTGIPS